MIIPKVQLSKSFGQRLGAFSIKPIFGLVSLNILIGLGLIGSQWLVRHALGEDILLIVIGSLAFFLPSLMLALTFEQLIGQSVSVSIIFLWTLISSLILVPSAIYYFDRILLAGTGVFDTLPAFLMIWILTAILYFIAGLVKKVKSGLFDIRIARKEVHELLLIGLGFILVLLLNFSLYRFIPEADSYWYLIQLQKAQLDPAILLHDPRVVFLTFVQLISSLTNIAPYFVMKFVLPLFYLSISGVIYLIARFKIQSTQWRVLVALSPLCFPVILQEALISRPQSLVVLTLVPVLYLVTQLNKSKIGAENLYWLIFFFVVGVLGLKIHTLMIFVILIAGLAVVRVLWPIFRNQPKLSVIGLFMFTLLSWPWLKSILILGDVPHLLKVSFQALQNNHFTLWFLSHYRNVDNTEVGWPGWTWVIYYGYNLGLVLPIALLWLVSARKINWLKDFYTDNYWSVLVIAGLMIVIAEVLPRFGLAFLPDRAWLFLALCFSMMIPYLLSSIFRQRLFIQLMLGVILILSISIGTALTYAKQGWVTLAEYNAMSFVKTTSSSSVFLGQGSSRPDVEYFGQRRFIQPPDPVFLDNNVDSVEAYLQSQMQDNKSALAKMHDRQYQLKDEYYLLGDQVGVVEGVQSQNELIERSDSLTSKLARADLDSLKLQQNYILDTVPVYLIYDETKFNSLYGRRAWWRASNFFGAKTDKFASLYPVVYDKAGVKIWKAR